MTVSAEAHPETLIKIKFLFDEECGLTGRHRNRSVSSIHEIALHQPAMKAKDHQITLLCLLFPNMWSPKAFLGSGKKFKLKQ